MKLKFKKTYKSGGGGYTTYVNGKLVNIDKQYSDNTWVAQSEDGEIDEERDTLVQLKYVLEKLNNSNEKFNDGGGLSNNDKIEINTKELKMNKGSEIIEKIGSVVINKEDVQEALSSAIMLSDINYYMFDGKLKKPIEEVNKRIANAKKEIEIVNKRLPFTTWQIKLKKGQNKFEFLGDIYEIYTEKKSMENRYNWEKIYYGVRKLTNNSEYDLSDYGIALNYTNYETKKLLLFLLNQSFFKLIFTKNEITLPLPVKPKYANGGQIKEFIYTIGGI
jgi:hypothetical protein